MNGILVLNEGRLRESGMQQDLLAQRHVHRRLYDLRFRNWRRPSLPVEMTSA